MPNWCENNFTVTFPKEHGDMARKLVEAFNTNALLQFLKPMPDELDDPDLLTFGGDNAELCENKRRSMFAKYGYPSWYEWRLSNWGTKWDIDTRHIDPLEVSVHDDHSVTVQGYFDSAWSPPVEAFLELRNIEGIVFSLYYYEPGSSFCGYANQDDDEYFGIDEQTPAWVANNIPRHIIENFDLANRYEEQPCQE
jgi:Ferredoxin-like domain in Api92-like protein